MPIPSAEIGRDARHVREDLAAACVAPRLEKGDDRVLVADRRIDAPGLEIEDGIAERAVVLDLRLWDRPSSG